MFALGEFSFGPDIARDSSGVRPGRYGAVVHGLEERVALRLALRARGARDSYPLATPSEYRVGTVGSAVGAGELGPQNRRAAPVTVCPWSREGGQGDPQ